MNEHDARTVPGARLDADEAEPRDEAAAPSGTTENPQRSVETEGRPEEPHAASRFDAGTGQGTVSGPPPGETQDRPILDGSTEGGEAERGTVNPHRGRADPSLSEWDYPDSDTALPPGRPEDRGQEEE